MKTFYTTRGFTLIELIIVIILLGVLSVTAVTRFNFHSFESAAVAGELIGAIRHAQSMSMVNTGDDPYQVVISNSGYTVNQSPNTDVTNPTSGDSTYVSNWSNVTLAPAPITIRFDGMGEPTFLPGIAGSQTITVTVGSDSRTVIVEQVTGFTR